MCDCGDPNGFKIFCPDHNGPFTEQKQIDNFIEKSFEPKILEKLNNFLDDFFLEFSKYLTLTEQCTFFCSEIFLKNIHNEREKDDVKMLKDNFCIVFQNFLNFIYLITNKNMGMLYLITKYLIKNHFMSKDLDEKFKTDHACIKYENKKIEIINQKEEKKEKILSLKDEKEEKSNNKHICECSFLRLLLSNWRDIIKSPEEENQNEKLLLSFANNIFFKENFSILYFFIFKDIMLNNNEDIITERNQYLSQEIILLIVNQTNIIENAYYIFYKYVKEIINIPLSKERKNELNPKFIKILSDKFIFISNDFCYFIRPKLKSLINSKYNLIKIVLDIACLFHNLCEYESIFPHPEFQDKKFQIDILNCELFLIKIINSIILCNDWNDKIKIKNFFDYIINKILNQNSEGIKQLKEKEYSFHLTLYRFFGIFLNYFSFNYVLNNNKNLYEAIEYIKNELFKSKEEMEKVIILIINDYFKMFGFITGIRNGYFNYYDSLEKYNEIYFNNLYFLKTDFTLLKFLLAMSEKKLNIDEILKVSNIENMYIIFNNVFKEKNLNNKDKINEDEKKHIKQWIRLFEIIINIMKNDSTYFCNILTFCEEIISSKSQNEIFNKIKNNKNMMNDLKNNLKEKLVLSFISNGNWLDLTNIKKIINEYFFKLFNEKEFCNLLNELTISKNDNKNNIIYILKDESFKYLDFDYFFSPVIKSKAELYINDFKKDIFKLFNIYYFKPSIISFYIHNKVFENILLNNENIELLIKIIEILLTKTDNCSNYINSIKEAFLPIILKFISIIGSIISKTFSDYKLENKNLFNRILDILNTSLKNNLILDKDLNENISNTIKQIKKFQEIYDNMKGNLNELDKLDYNYDINFKDNLNIKNINKENLVVNSKKEKSIKMKEKYKNLIKKKRNNFIEKIKYDKRMTNIIESKNNNTEKEKDDIMCFFCRNSINLNSFENPYGKIINFNKDFFYQNSFRSSIRKELNKICKKDTEEKNKIFNKIKENDINKDFSIRIVSCGHYFHQKCFNERLKVSDKVKCPVCEKKGNILIPPMTIFYGKDNYLESEKLNDILNKEYEVKNKKIKENSDIFKENIISFIQSILNIKLNPKIKLDDFQIIINDVVSNFIHNLNYLGNLYECEATTFYKQQQIDNIQNLILIIRYLIKIDYININQIIKYIRNEIENIIKGPFEKENIMDNYTKMYYAKQFDKIIFLFMLLLDTDDMQKLFPYIMNWILPYFIFWIYLRSLITENNFYSLYDEKMKEKININAFGSFLNNNNKIIIDYLKLFLQKLLYIKIIMKFDYKKTDIFNNINNMSLENLFSELINDNFYQKLSKNNNNENNIKDIIDNLANVLISDNSFITKDYIILDPNIIINLLIKNISKMKEEKYLLNAEFFYQFILYKFDFIELEWNVFDFIEKYLFENCSMCKKPNKNNCLCIICGNKICQSHIINHTFKCTFSDIIYMNLQNMKLISFSNFQLLKNMFSVYTNKYNDEPNSDFISNEYNFNKDRYKLALKIFNCQDFHLT